MIFILFLLYFSANSRPTILIASLTIRLTKFFFKLTRFFASLSCYVAVIVICFPDKSLPLNPLWVFEQLSGTADCEDIVLKIFTKGFTFVYNYWFWKMVSIQGYCIILDILISVLSISYSQHVAHR